MPDSAEPRRAERIQHLACGEGAGEDAKRIGNVLAERQSGGLATPLGAGNQALKEHHRCAIPRRGVVQTNTHTATRRHQKKNLKQQNRNTTDKTDHDPRHSGGSRNPEGRSEESPPSFQRRGLGGYPPLFASAKGGSGERSETQGGTTAPSKTPFNSPLSIKGEGWHHSPPFQSFPSQFKSPPFAERKGACNPSRWASRGSGL